MKVLQHVEYAIVGGGREGCRLARKLAGEGKTFVLMEMTPFLGGLDRFKRWSMYDEDPLNGMIIDADRYLTRTIVQTITPQLRLLAEKKDGLLDIQADAVWVATGSYEEPIVFPGWTLPGVLTKQAAQLMHYRDNVAIGKRIVYLHKDDEADDFLQELSDSTEIYPLNVREVEKLACFGHHGVERVRYSVGGRERQLDGVDAVICASRRLPTLELLQMAGAEIEERQGDLIPIISAEHETSIPGLFVYGSASGKNSEGGCLEIADVGRERDDRVCL